MKTISKKTFRLLSLASISILLATSFSCKKENKNSTPTGPGGGGTTSLPLVARADLNFVDDGDAFTFKCYEEKDYGEVIVHGDTSMVLRFRDVDKNGDYVLGTTLIISLENMNGFHQGDVYTVTDDPNDKAFWLSLMKNDTDMMSYMVGNDIGNPGSGELTITYFDGSHIKGVFNYTAKSLVEPIKEVIISNGEFESNKVVFN